MSEALPRIEVTESHTQEDSDVPTAAAKVAGSSEDPSSLKDERITSASEARDSVIEKVGSNKLTRVGTSKDGNALITNGEVKINSNTAIDPLSRHILKRTHTENTIPPKLRTGTGESTEKSRSPTGQPNIEVATVNRASTEPPRNDGGGLNKDRKKGVSFLSRFIGSKKKESAEDFEEDESDLGDGGRTEGTNAHVFSQPIGFIPQFPPPPKYIKVRSRNKKKRDFDRVFLAQQLDINPRGIQRAPSIVSANEKEKASKRSGATWALEFSKDGKYLAAGGQDKIVRVWAVISTPDERKMHENDEDAISGEGTGERLNAPVFRSRPVQEYEGHSADVLDLSWSKNNFLLSSSMDKTVRLWHVTRAECLCCFKHNDFVTSIQFHPRDDRFFLAGSLDSKLRLWSIPDKNVAFSNRIPDMITAVSFSPDGKTAIAGCLNGLCLFYETEGLKYMTQIHVRSSHGRNAKGSKITGIEYFTNPPGDPSGEVKLLITSNDSRIRLYNFRDKSLEAKFKGNENTCSQIHARFSDDGRYVICGSEDRKVYIWPTAPIESEKKDKRPVEMFEAHSAIVTSAVLAPTRTKQWLGASGDPVYDLCNPPPVTLVSRADSESSKVPTDVGQTGSEANGNGTPTAEKRRTQRVEESPAYIARSTHREGNIIVTADYLGQIKVFRQDCAFQKRRSDLWETSSNFSKRISTGIIGRSASIATRNSSTSRRGSISRNVFTTPQSSENILSWRNSIISNGSLDRPGYRNRSTSPRKSLGQFSPVPSGMRQSTQQHFSSQSNNSSSVAITSKPQTDRSSEAQTPWSGQPVSAPEDNPLMLQEMGDSLAFWNMQTWKTNSALNRDPSKLSPADISRQESKTSILTSSEGESDSDGGPSSGRGSEIVCRNCGSSSFKAKNLRGTGQGLVTRLVCSECGRPA